jgi:CRISPR/Cas system CSM-associated protein Csm4 (group 5 of RAMP superfamily)
MVPAVLEINLFINNDQLKITSRLSWRQNVTKFPFPPAQKYVTKQRLLYYSAATDRATHFDADIQSKYLDP